MRRICVICEHQWLLIDESAIFLYVKMLLTFWLDQKEFGNSFFLNEPNLSDVCALMIKKRENHKS